jgi:hypothetical protein
VLSQSRRNWIYIRLANQARGIETLLLFSQKADRELPLMAYVEEKEERQRLHNTGRDMIYENIFQADEITI